MPSTSRTRSVPQTCDQTPCAGLTPMHSGRKSFDFSISSRGTMLSFRIVLLVVDVVDESVQRIDALREPARDDVPLALDDESRNDVERPLAIDRAAAFTGVDGERDAHRPNGDFGSGLARGEFVDPTTRPTCGTDLSAPWRARPRSVMSSSQIPVAWYSRPVDRHFFLYFATAF